jgi:hypothetical protein
VRAVGKESEYRLIRISKLQEVHGQPTLYVPKIATKALGWQKGEEVKVLLDEKKGRILLERNRPVKARR